MRGEVRTINNVQSDSPSIVSVFLFVIIVRVGGAQGLHFGSALSFILQVADQIVSGNFYGLKGFPSHW